MSTSRTFTLAVALLLVGLWFLRGQAPLATVVTLTPVIDVFQGSGQSYFILTRIPAASTHAMVFVNGLLMEAGTDYTLSANTLQFTGQDVAGMDQPVVQVLYWAP